MQHHSTCLLGVCKNLKKVLAGIGLMSHWNSLLALSLLLSTVARSASITVRSSQSPFSAWFTCKCITDSNNLKHVECRNAKIISTANILTSLVPLLFRLCFCVFCAFFFAGFSWDLSAVTFLALFSFFFFFPDAYNMTQYNTETVSCLENCGIIMYKRTRHCCCFLGALVVC